MTTLNDKNMMKFNGPLISGKLSHKILQINGEFIDTSK